MTRAAPTPDALDRAYRTCEAITRDQARNFYWGIRLLPAPKRAALCAVYALARRIDDVGDEPGDASPDSFAEKRAVLAAIRTSVEELHPSGPRGDGRGDDPVLLAVADAATRYPIPLGAFVELVDGVDADVDADARAADGHVLGREPTPSYATFEELVGYCRRVAGSVGRLCLGIFGQHGPVDDASRYADTLGIALQQTNILRDVREDLAHGRIYLPADELAAHDVELALGPDGVLLDPDGGLAELIGAAADRARGWYAEGLRLVPMLDRRSAACATAMAGIYQRLLLDIASAPASTYGRRRSLSTGQKIAVATRALAGRGIG